MQTCPRCGSIRMRRRRASVLSQVVAIFTGRRPHICERCGWRGRLIPLKPTRKALVRTASDEDFSSLSVPLPPLEGSEPSAHLALDQLDAWTTTSAGDRHLETAVLRVHQRVHLRPHASEKRRMRPRKIAGIALLAVVVGLVLTAMLLAAGCNAGDLRTPVSHGLSE